MEWNSTGHVRGTESGSSDAPGRGFAALRDRGLVRQTNQDEAVASSFEGGWTLLAVADGVGGAPGGEIASRAAVEALEEALGPVRIDEPGQDLLTAIEAANARVLTMASGDEAHPNMATTLVAALVDAAGHAWIVNVGDSRGYVISAGEARQVTSDHSWVADRVRSGEMTEAEAEVSPHQNVITRAIGAESNVEFARIVEVHLGPGDCLLLCSDGLYRMVDASRMAATLGSAPQLSAITRQLVEMANAAGGVDNIAVALYRR